MRLLSISCASRLLGGDRGGLAWSCRSSCRPGTCGFAWLQVRKLISDHASRIAWPTVVLANMPGLDIVTGMKGKECLFTLGTIPSSKNGEVLCC